MILEVCANSFRSAQNAQDAGADRIEICSELAIGGITPSYGLLRKVTQELSIDVYVLIRPRGGNFTYSDDELDIMKTNIDICKSLGVKGIVSGILNHDNTIDISRTSELIELAKPMSFSFHRGFDWTPNPYVALQQLIDIGVSRILTSGQQPSVEKGIELLKELKELADDKIIILPGGGVTIDNASTFREAGFTEIHASLLTLETVNEAPTIPMNSNKLYTETAIAVSSLDSLKELIKNIK